MEISILNDILKCIRIKRFFQEIEADYLSNVKIFVYICMTKIQSHIMLILY